MRLITILMTLALSGGAAAQERQFDPERLEQLRAQMQETRERLGLSDEQMGQVGPILRAGLVAQMQVLREYGFDPRSGGRGGLAPRQLRQLADDLDEVREETVEELAAVLSEEQLEEYREIVEERRQANRERLRRRR